MADLEGKLRMYSCSICYEENKGYGPGATCDGRCEIASTPPTADPDFSWIDRAGERIVMLSFGTQKDICKIIREEWAMGTQ